MKGLDRFETFAERFLEGSLGRLMGGRLEPVDLAKQLARVMDDHQTVGAGKVFVPNNYEVHLNPTDFNSFKSFQTALEEELGTYLAETAERRQFHFVGRPHVSLVEDNKVKVGDPNIVAKLMDAQGVTFSGPGMTQELQVAQAPAAAQAQASASPMLAWLADGIREVPIRAARLTLGRALDNDMILEGAGVSRHHAQVERRHGRYILRDLGSKHGTLVNNQRIEEVVLRDGDIVTIGGQRVVFRLTVAPGDNAAPPPAAPPRSRGA